MAIKIGTFDPTQYADVAQKCVLIDPANGNVLIDDNADDCGLWVYGADSRVYKAVASRQTDALLSTIGTGAPGRQITEASAKADQLELLVAATKDWWNIDIDGSGNATPFSIEAVTKCYRQSPWIVEQVERFIKNRRNFLPKPAAVAG